DPFLLARVKEENGMILSDVQEGKLHLQVVARELQHRPLQRIDVLRPEVLEAVEHDANVIAWPPRHGLAHALEGRNRALDAGFVLACPRTSCTGTLRARTFAFVTRSGFSSPRASSVSLGTCTSASCHGLPSSMAARHAFS